MKFTSPVSLNARTTIQPGGSYTSIITVDTTPIDIPSSELIGNYIITLLGDDGPSSIAALSKSQIAVAGDVLEIASKKDASDNYYTITWNANEKPKISCTATKRTTIYLTKGGSHALHPDRAGLRSYRSTYDNQQDGFCYYASDEKCFYIRTGPTSGNWSDKIDVPSTAPSGGVTGQDTVSSTAIDIPSTNTTGSYLAFIKSYADGGPVLIAALSKSQASNTGDIFILANSADASLNEYQISWPANSRPRITCDQSYFTNFYVTTGGVPQIDHDNVLRYMWAFTD